MNIQVKDQYMQPRIMRLNEFLGDKLFESTLWGHEYDLTLALQ